MESHEQFEPSPLTVCWNTLAEFGEKLAKLVNCPPARTADQWADANRQLPKGSAEPGQWRSSRTPYTIGIVRAFAIPGIARIVFIMATQMGKSALSQNVIGWRIDYDPAPCIYIGPTQSNIDGVIEPKFMEMINSTPALKDKLTGKSKHNKRMGGVSLRFGWAGSASEMASDSAAIVIVDELDRMVRDVAGEGDPVEQAEARSGTYPDGKVGVTSTPKIGHVEVVTDERTGFVHWQREHVDNVQSPIWRLWQEGSRHEWAVPCPHCSEYFVPRFSLLWWPKGADEKTARREARLTCASCGGQIEDHHRQPMNVRGVFVAPGQIPLQDRRDATRAQIVDHNELDANGEPLVFDVDFGDAKPVPGDTSMTFWVSGLCAFSPKKSYGFLAAKWVAAVNSGEPERIQGVINTDFGELYHVSGDAPTWQYVANCALRSHQRGTLPAGAVLITAGVDVQGDRLEYVVRAWGPGLSSWLIETGELHGDTDRPDVWVQLSELLSDEWGGLTISRMAVDSGYRPEFVYQFCLGHPAAVPTKGRDKLDKLFYSSDVDVNSNGRVIKGGISLWHYHTDTAKSWVHGQIRKMNSLLAGCDQAAIHVKLEEIAGDPGGWYVYDGIEVDYCKQIVSEQRIVKRSGDVLWKEVGANHKFDAECMAYVAARSLGAGRRSRAMISESASRPQRRPAPPGRGIRSRGVEV